MKEMVGWEEFVGSMGIDEKTPAGVCRQGFWIFGMSTWDTFGWRNNRAGWLSDRLLQRLGKRYRRGMRLG
jgi:hypothetical protein